jgi:hypothetical protein
MATVRKTTAKKTTVASKTAATKAKVPTISKKTVPPKKLVSKTTKSSTRNKVSASQPVKMRSFRISPNNPSFTTFKITRQTLYWVIIIGFIIAMQLWIIAMQIETSDFIENQLTELNNQ